MSFSILFLMFYSFRSLSYVTVLVFFWIFVPLRTCQKRIKDKMYTRSIPVFPLETLSSHKESVYGVPIFKPFIIDFDLISNRGYKTTFDPHCTYYKIL